MTEYRPEAEAEGQYSVTCSNLSFGDENIMHTVSLLARINVLSKSGNPNIIPNLPVANTSPRNGLDK